MMGNENTPVSIRAVRPDFVIDAVLRTASVVHPILQKKYIRRFKRGPMIKYRIFYEPAKRFTKQLLDTNGTVRMNWEMPFELHQEDYIVQQWTGLVDLNGKEIFEGDILLDLKEWKLLTVKKQEAPVRFFGENFYLDSTMTEPHISEFELENKNSRYRVIGTIFGLNEMPCKPDHNGECLICDCWLSECHLHEHLNSETLK